MQLKNYVFTLAMIVNMPDDFLLLRAKEKLLTSSFLRGDCDFDKVMGSAVLFCDDRAYVILETVGSVQALSNLFACNYRQI